MSVANVQPLDEETLAECAAKAREVDRQEAMLQTGKPLDEALWRSYRMSTGCYAGRLDDDLVCVWGVAALAPLEGIGQPWLVATPMIDRAAFPFLRQCWYYLNKMKDDHDFLWNVVWEENTAARQWLAWMGFEMKQPQNVGPFNRKFIPFEWSADV